MKISNIGLSSHPEYQNNNIKKSPFKTVGAVSIMPKAMQGLKSMNDISQSRDEKPVILIVDDVPQNIQLLGSILTNEGYRVAVAMNAQQALEMVSHFQPDLIILDIMLPDMDGYELCRQLKAHERLVPVPIIFITAKKQLIDEIKGFESGAVDYIVKPFNTAIVFERIKVHLNLKLAQEKLKNYNAQLDRQVQMRTRALKASEEKYRSVFENAGAGTIIIAPDGTIIMANSAFAGLTGYSKAEIDHRIKWTNFLDQTGHKAFSAVRDAMLNSTASARKRWEIDLKTKSGAIRHVVVNFDVITDSSLIIASLTDITTLKMAQAELRDSEKRFMTLFESAPDAYCISDLNGTLCDGNKAFLKLFGYQDKQAMIGRKMVAGSIIDRLFAAQDHETDDDRVDKTETAVELADGVRMDIEIKSMPVKIKGNDYILGIFRDITESKRTEKKLREAEQTLRKENQLLISMVDGRYRFGDIIGKSSVMHAVYKLILKAAASDANVVITGQTGTGKELVARAIHKLSARKNKNFVPVNCGAISEHIIESEFFGYKKGAFTGANTDKKGFLDAAHQGTLFLDEVGEIGLNMQIKLLRATEGGDYTPVGGNRPTTSDFRIIAATNSDLSQRVKQGLIRSDFFFRIQVITIELPPLKDRKEDLPLLVEHFAKGKKVPEHIMEALHYYDWPGNVRELQNVIKRYFALKRLDFTSLSSSGSDGSHRPDISSDDGMSRPVETLKHSLGRVEKKVISEALIRHRWHKGKVCADLGIDRKTLNTKIQTHALGK